MDNGIAIVSSGTGLVVIVVKYFTVQIVVTAAAFVVLIGIIKIAV